MWAEENLATPLHPIVLDVTTDGEEVGNSAQRKAPGILCGRVGERAKQAPFFLSKEDLRVQSDGPLVSEDGIAPRGFLVFSRGAAVPPRMLWFREFSEARNAIREKNPASSRRGNCTGSEQRFSNQTIADYISEKVPYVDREQALNLIDEGVGSDVLQSNVSHQRGMSNWKPETP